jgi:CO/xanthine dehydrogenase Mo-binding subunit
MTSPSLQSAPFAQNWLRFTPDGLFELRSGKVELGQGISAALIQIGCNALGIGPDQVTWRAGDTEFSPDEGFTAGSQSIEVGGAAWQRVGDIVRSHFALLASERLSCKPTELSLCNGTFSGPTGEKLSYHQLVQVEDSDWENLRVDTENPFVIPIHAASVQIKRTDLWLKFTGNGFIHDRSLPDMWHARILRGPHPFARALHLNIAQLEELKGVERVLVQNDFVALLGRDEGRLIKAHAQAKSLTSWTCPELPRHEGTPALLQQWDRHSSIPLSCTDGKALVPPAGPDERSLQHQYSRPFIAHASIGPACALACPDPQGGLVVWSHSQGVFKLRDQIAQALQLEPATVQVKHAPGAGCYGHNGADDVAFDAAFIAQTWGLNVRVQWSREDELSVSPMGAASLIDIQAGLNGDGHIHRWHVQVWSPTHLNRPGWGDGIQLLGAWSALPNCHPPTPMDVPLPTGGGLRNAVPAYDVGNLTVEHHFLDTSPVRVSALRSLGAHANVFAIESMMDELSELNGEDPGAFRLKHLSDPRARHVIQKVLEVSDWHLRGEAGSGHGYGLAYARYKNKAGYCAIVAHVEVSDRVKVHKIWACVDVGIIVHSDGLLNQIEGGILQAISWSLLESVQWNDQGISSNDWDQYPILSFQDVPPLEIHLVQDTLNPSLGSGEVATGPCAGALGNAVANALGIRARHLPLNPENLLQCINQDVSASNF